MNKYIKPEMVVVSLETINIIAISSNTNINLQTWGSNLKTVDSNDVDNAMDMFK